VISIQTLLQYNLILEQKCATQFAFIFKKEDKGKTKCLFSTEY